MRSRWALATILIASVVWPHAADSDQPCEVVPMPCTFESLPFKFKVADAETHQPLADVHALAEWQTEGVGGRANGPLMVTDTVSDSDGLISFDAWGPIEGPWTGLVIGSDPVVTLFTSGYKALILNNGYLPPGRERERVPICAEGFNARTGAVSGHAGGVVEGASARLCWPCLFTER